MKHLLGLQSEVQLIGDFLRLVTLINLSTSVEVTLGHPFLWRSSIEPVSSQLVMVFVTALEETFKVLEIFQINDLHVFNQ